jgi:hypothetical protein
MPILRSPKYQKEEEEEKRHTPCDVRVANIPYSYEAQQIKTDFVWNKGVIFSSRRALTWES